MVAEVIEGTMEEVQRRLSALTVAPETRLRVIVTEPEISQALPPEPFRPSEFRNGVPLLPRREISQPVSLELVNQLLQEEDEETLRAYRTA
jgi:hypothetical protein